jgi:uncharacterized membrane protein
MNAAASWAEAQDLSASDLKKRSVQVASSADGSEVTAIWTSGNEGVRRQSQRAGSDEYQYRNVMSPRS